MLLARSRGGRSRSPPAAMARRRRAIALALAVTLPGGLLAAQQPAPMRALFIEAEDLMRRGRLDEATSRYRELVAQIGDRERAEIVWRAAARVRLAEIDRRAGLLPRAEGGYVRVIEEEPASVWTSRARLGLAGLLLGRGEWEPAAELLQRVVSSAERGAAAGDVQAADQARRLLTLVHRFVLRAMHGRGPWTRAAALTVAGLELDRPVHVAAGGDGQLLVVDEGAPAVVLIDATHGAFSALNYNEHTRPWWGSDGLPYLPTRRAGIIALGGGRLGFLAREDDRPVPLKELRGGARGADGRWYLLDLDPPRVLQFGAEGEFEGVAYGPADGEAVDVAADPWGRVHVLDAKARAVLRLGPHGRPASEPLVGTWRRPVAVEADALGNVYVLDRAARTIDVLTRDGERIARLGPSLPGGIELRDPRDLAVDGTGRAYVADRRASAVVVIE